MRKSFSLPSESTQKQAASWWAVPLTLILFPLFPTGCAPEAPSAPAFTTRDSAGVIIAENHGPFGEGPEEWVVSPEPSLEIGALDGDEAYLFDRIVGASKLSDGSIAVLDSRATNLRIYSPSGEHLGTFGSRGEGPGEFSSPRELGALQGDTLVVADSRLRRINLFHPDTGFIGSATTSTEIPGFLLTEGVFSSGSLLAQRLVFGDNTTDGYARRPVHYRAVAKDGSLEADLGEFPGEEMIIATQTEGQGTVSFGGNAPFSRNAQVAVGAHHFYYSSQDRYEIQVISQTGVLERIIRVVKEPEPITPAQVDALMEEELRELPDSDLARRYRRFFEEAPIPEFHPAHGPLYVDREGLLWVEETRVSEEEPRLFSIFDAEGRFAGSVALPSDLRILEIGRDYILARVADDLGVQRLRQYRLTRPVATQAH